MDKQYQLPSDFKSENYSEPYSIRVETLEDFKENEDTPLYLKDVNRNSDNQNCKNSE